MASVREYAILYPKSRPNASGAGIVGGGSVLLTVPQHPIEGAEHTARTGALLINNIISPTQLAANTDNWAPTSLATADLIRISTDASRNLTGISAPSTGRAIVLVNVGLFDLILKHDVTSTAANRFYCPNGHDMTLGPNTATTIEYDLTSGRWRVVGGPTDDPSDVAGLGMVPYLLAAGETFLVPTGKQALFADTIELVGDAEITVDGELIEVNGPVEGGSTTTGLTGQFLGADGAGGLVMRYPPIPGVHMLNDGGGSDEPGPPGPPGRIGVDGAPGAPGAPATNMIPEDYSGMFEELIRPPHVPFRITDDAATPVVIGDAKAVSFPAGTVVDLGGGTAGIRQVPYGAIGCSVYHATTQSISNGVVTALLMNTELFDTDSFHSTSSNTSRATIPAGMSGKYLLIIQASYAASATGIRYSLLMKNGADVANYVTSPGTAADAIYVRNASVLDLAAGDYVESGAYQVSGGALNTANGESMLMLYKLDAGRVGSGIGASVNNNAVAQAIANATNVALTFSTEVFDTDGFHSTSSNTSRQTIPAGLGGKYIVSGNVSLATASATGYRSMSIRVNSATYFGALTFDPASVQYGTVTAVLDLLAGDYVEIITAQSSGGSVNTDAALYGAQMQIARLDSGGAAAAGKGTAFPTGPATNDVFFRTDLGEDFYYDGTRWLSKTLRTIQLTKLDGLAPNNTATSIAHAPVLSSPASMYLVDFIASLLYTGTNTGANYWGLTLRYRDSTNTGTNINTAINTSADPAGTAIVVHTASLNAVLSVNARWLDVQLSKTGTPSGSVYDETMVTYRLIAT